MPMSAGDWLAATGAVLLALVLGALLFALGSVVLTLRELRATVRALQEQSIAMADEMRIALRDAEHEVDRVGALLSAAEMVGDRVDTASKIVSRTVTNPVVKVLALGTGTKRAVKRMRGVPSEADTLGARGRPTSGAWAERAGPQDRERER
jgi:prophage DNA circulation protein